MSAWSDLIPEWMPAKYICCGRLIGLLIDKYNDCYRVGFGLWFGQIVIMVPRKRKAQGKSGSQP